MSTYNSIAWLPLCAALTGVGLVISWFVMRRRGLGSGLRGAAWSLLPVAAYLTGSIKMFYKIGTAIGDFAASFVLSPKVWSGVGVAGLAAVLFVVSGPAKRRRRARRVSGAGAHGETSAPVQPGSALEPAAKGEPDKNVPAGKRKGALETSPARAAKKAPADDDMREVEEILRRRGID
jgi:hypothetical protein